MVRKISDILVYLQREKSIGDEMIMTINRDGMLIEKVLVLGESCEDVFVYGKVTRLCPVAPAPVFNPITKKIYFIIKNLA